MIKPIMTFVSPFAEAARPGAAKDDELDAEPDGDGARLLRAPRGQQPRLADQQQQHQWEQEQRRSDERDRERCAGGGDAGRRVRLEGRRADPQQAQDVRHGHASQVHSGEFTPTLEWSL